MPVPAHATNDAGREIQSAQRRCVRLVAGATVESGSAVTARADLLAAICDPDAP